MSDFSKQIIYLSDAQRQELFTNDTITVDGVTVTYNENDIYITPQAEPVTDVRINGTSIAANGVANIPVADRTVMGVGKVADDYGIQRGSSGLSDYLITAPAGSALIKSAAASNQGTYKPITPRYQHEATFYGLAKVAGHDEASSTESVGTYTPEAKGAIQQMLGVSDLIATAENNLVASKAYAIGDVFTANGKLYKATAAIAADAAIIPAVEGEEIVGANCVETSISEGFPHDVQVNGMSVVQNGVANVPLMGENTIGVAKLGSNNGLYGLIISGGTLMVNPAGDYEIKTGSGRRKPITSEIQNKSVFYALAQAAGDTTQSASSNAVGVYTDEAKLAIRTMLGAGTYSKPVAGIPATDLASDVVPVQDVQINGTSILNNGVANVPVASTSNLGTVKIDDGYGISIASSLYGSPNALRINKAAESHVKAGASDTRPIVPSNQHQSTFYGLAKAAGADEKNSTLPVGQYTDTAKAAIRSMIGATSSNVIAVQDTQPTDTDTKIWLPATAETPVEVPTVAEMNAALSGKVGDVQVNGTSVVSNGVANIPLASSSSPGVAIVKESYGISIRSSSSTSPNTLQIACAGTDQIKEGANNVRAIVPYTQHSATFYGLAKAAGDTTQSQSDNAVGTYTDEAKSAIQTMLGIDLSSIASQVEIPLVETVTGAAVTITGQPNTRYMCGEVTSISITPPAAGSIDVVFTSGSTVAVLTLPSTVKMPEWFDATTLDANTVYEILITDGVYGSVMTWAV